jgi:hypothetical protein
MAVQVSPDGETKWTLRTNGLGPDSADFVSSASDIGCGLLNKNCGLHKKTGRRGGEKCEAGFLDRPWRRNQCIEQDNGDGRLAARLRFEVFRSRFRRRLTGTKRRACHLCSPISIGLRGTGKATGRPRILTMVPKPEVTRRLEVNESLRRAAQRG